MNSNILNIYNKHFCKYFNINKEFILIRSIHNDEHICFNCTHREILYALNKYFKEYSKLNNIYDDFYGQVKESIYGKAYIITPKHICLEPNIKRIFFLYNKEFLKRINLIENYYKLLPHEIKKKKYSLHDYLEIYKLGSKFLIPNEVLNIIHSFLFLDFESYFKVRQCYELNRKNKYI